MLLPLRRKGRIVLITLRRDDLIVLTLRREGLETWGSRDAATLH